MSDYFPKPFQMDFFGNTQTHYKSGKSEVIFTPVNIGSKINLHNHLAAQIGMCSGGSYLMKCAEDKTTIYPYQNACNVQPYVYHGAPFEAEEAYVSLDIKRDPPEPKCYEGKGGFYPASEEQTFATGFKARIVTAPWFKILYSKLPPGACLPFRDEGAEVIGIPLSGKTLVKIGGQEKICDKDVMYFAPSSVDFETSNPFDEEATVVIAFILV